MKTTNQNVLKSTLKLTLLVGILFTFSCSTETVEQLESSTDSEFFMKNSNPKARPISATLSNIPDPNQDPATLVSCAPEGSGAFLTRNIISGNMTHLGKLRPGNADGTGTFGNPVSCSFNESFTEIASVYEVNYVAANGDEVRTVENVTIIFNLDDDPTYATGTFEGTIEIVGGSGRFDGATGQMEFVNATFGPEGSNWEIFGEIIY